MLILVWPLIAILTIVFGLYWLIVLPFPQNISGLIPVAVGGLLIYGFHWFCESEGVYDQLFHKSRLRKRQETENDEAQPLLKEINKAFRKIDELELRSKLRPGDMFKESVSFNNGYLTIHIYINDGNDYGRIIIRDIKNREIQATLFDGSYPQLLCREKIRRYIRSITVPIQQEKANKERIEKERRKAIEKKTIEKFWGE